MDFALTVMVSTKGYHFENGDLNRWLFGVFD